LTYGLNVMWTDEHREKLSAVYSAFIGAADISTAGLDSLQFVNYLLEIENSFGIELPEACIDRAVFCDLSTSQCKIIELLQKVG